MSADLGSIYFTQATLRIKNHILVLFLWCGSHYIWQIKWSANFGRWSLWDHVKHRLNKNFSAFLQSWHLVNEPYGSVKFCIHDYFWNSKYFHCLVKGNISNQQLFKLSVKWTMWEFIFSSVSLGFSLLFAQNLEDNILGQWKLSDIQSLIKRYGHIN